MAGSRVERNPMSQSSIAPSGTASLRVVRSSEGPFDHPSRELTVREMVRYGFPRRGLHPTVNQWRARNLSHLLRGMWRVLAARALHLNTAYGQLWLSVHTAEHGDLDLGLASLRVITTAGVNKLVAGLDATDTATFSAFKYHGIGTGTTAEATSDTALVTELTTQYNPDNTRPTGTQGVGATNNVYRTIATITPDAELPLAITEHGIFSAATFGTGTLLDRSVFAAVNLTSSGDGIVAQYDGTFAAGG